MRKILLLSLGFLISQRSISQCDVNTAASQMTVTCGQSVSLTAFGSSTGSIILNENFNSGGFGAGWGATPGSTSFSNPCSPGGVDGTSHAWMDNNTSVPRTLTSQAYNLTSATAGVSICFDLLFAEQGDAAPCEGPDEPDEGVYLQYSIDGGATWIDIFYFDPNGGNDPQLTNWNNYCFAIPPAAITANTIFRWHQLADSGADYDHWGIDNVQIFQNDINAEVEWLHDGYSYGVGNPGGVNPNAVTPTTTTTYTAQITTGTGQVCTSSITITVLAPVYDVDVTANPTTLCVGDCATISGTAQIVLDPGGIETYENTEFALVASGSASVNINVQGINTTSISAGLIEEMVINGFNFSGSSLCTNFFGGCPCNGATINFGQTCNLNTSGFTVTLTAPGGCDIILVPAGVATGNYSNTTFVPVGGSAFGGTFPNGGTWNPSEPFSGLNGCNPNGVWTLTFSAPGLGIGLGTLTGWSITFNDPPIYQPVNATWSPAAGLSSTNTINTTACPTSSTNYVLTLNNGTAGCPTYTETFPITVDPCGGCTPPVFTVTPPPAFCLPGTYNLTGAISGTGANLVTYHLTNADATNDVNPMGSTIVSAAGTYFVRVEDPTDPTCFSVQSIVVTTTTPANATFTFANFCATAPNGPSGIVTPGGTFAFSPAPTDGATINTSTGVITNPVAGNAYSVQYTTSGACPSSTTVSVTATAPANATFNFINFCSTDPNGPSGIATPGGTFAFSPAPTDGATINTSTGVITNPVAGNSYSIQYTTAGACPASSTVSVTAIDCSSCTPPVFTVTNPAAVCDPSTIDLVSTVSGTGVNLVSYYANNADATAAVNPLGSTIVAVSGTYWVRVEDPTDPTCNTIQSVVVTINPTDDASFTFAAFCAGAVNGPSGIVTAGGTFAFNPAVTDGATINPATGVISNGVATTTYTVEYTTAGVCPSSSTQNVLVNDCIGCIPPVLTLNPGAFCAGTTFDLANTVDTPLGTVIYTYHATNLDATNDANAINSVITNPGTYWVRAEDSADPTCFTVAQVTITEIPLPLIVLSVTNTSCELSNGAIDATISAGSGNYTYTWSNSTTTVDLVNLLPGIYSLIVVDNLTGCTNNASASVQPSATPSAAFNMNPVVMNFPDHISVSDNLSNGATTYLWTVNGENFDFVSSSTDISLDLPIDTGNYEVCLIAFNGPDCSDTTCGYIEIRDEFVIWVPNTFTPDADEYNNVFSPVVSMIDIYNYDFFIYNRWGEIIFESHDVNIGWDGTYKERLVKEGVYTWKIRLKSIYTDEYRDYNGHVNMLR
ncbi:MAG: gliding motility-associated C-terminal domain-containing protein [Crocinitomicaceae bacterium]|jgi:gliding motility-associated-like protein|nr:gliding motility-associated C-terminal domain-containing protein [Crocinitomicaceae bacterium]